MEELPTGTSFFDYILCRTGKWTNDGVHPICEPFVSYTAAGVGLYWPILRRMIVGLVAGCTLASSSSGVAGAIIAVSAVEVVIYTVLRPWRSLWENSYSLLSSIFQVCLYVC